MKNLLRRLHLGGSADDSTSADGSKSLTSSSTKHRFSFGEPGTPNTDAGVGSYSSASSSPDHKPLSGFSNWINAAKNTLHPSSSSSSNQNVGLFSSGSPKKKKDETSNNTEQEVATLQERQNSTPATLDFGTDAKAADVASVLDAGIEAESGPFGFMVERPPALSLEAVEEYQLQVAMALSVSDDPEAADIEKAKQISLGSDLPLKDTSAEVLAFRYWKYNALDYDDKVVDGFYDVYGVVAGSDSSSDTMPALVDLQETSVSDEMTSEVVLVNRAVDVELVNLEQKALTIALDSEASTVGLEKSGLVQEIANIVVNHMGGPVSDADLLLRRWRENTAELRASLGTVVLPLGRLQIGLARHRALLFKVLADVAGIPCQLVKGRQYTGGSDAESFNIVKIHDGRAYIIDLMGAPGTLIPSDVSGSLSLSNASVDAENLSKPMASSTGSLARLAVPKENKPVKSQSQEVPLIGRHPYVAYDLKDVEEKPLRGGSRHPSRRFTSHSRSPSWTEGIGSPAVNMKAKDASRYMMDAAKENPKLAQKLHDVLLESGVRAPPGLFAEVSSKQLQDQITEDVKFLEEKQKQIVAKGVAVRRKELSSVGLGRPPPPGAPSHSSSSEDGGKERLQRLNSVEGLGERRPLEPSYVTSPNSSPSSTASSGAAVQSSSPVLPSATAVSIVQESLAPEIIKHVPVAAAAAATAAVVASSMVVAAAKSDMGDPTLEVPVAAAATATAAVVVATSAVVGRRLELYEVFPDPANEESREKANQNENTGKHEESPVDNIPEGRSSGGSKFAEEERVSGKSSGSVSARYDPILDDVPEILWEDLVIGERIGLGSYGEVYRGEWHGTEVAVKKFLNQDISGAALEEFGSEVRLMKRMRHPNVVLFMGAVMRTPNLSIVTEFLPRGSLYRLIHRPNNQLDERRRMRMALDVARGMNYLHSSTPMIVHRDLKSPNLLVDKNWVVKVCDFGLSRLKHNTFLSSKSTAGTPEWMAPEVLRNEPSNEKSDVYSFGVILWELATLQQPWAGMNPMQVVGAVGFQYRCLDIPPDLDPTLARIIRQCWQSDPNARPSFGDIMDALKPLQRALVVAAQQSQVPKS